MIVLFHSFYITVVEILLTMKGFERGKRGNIGRLKVSDSEYHLSPLESRSSTSIMGKCSDHNINNFFVKTVLKYTFFKRSWHH